VSRTLRNPKRNVRLFTLTDDLAHQKGVQAVAIKADVSRDAEAKRLVAESVQALGRIDTLVTCAGWTRRTLHHNLEEADEETWDKTWSVNVKGAFFCARAVIPEMQRIGGGAIINATSIGAFTGQGSSIPYCASKAAMTSVTKTLARAFAPTIRANAIAPGLVGSCGLARGHCLGKEGLSTPPNR
jgi:3-oxoacyl-[acyl-carrier protein] reductase